MRGFKPGEPRTGRASFNAGAGSFKTTGRLVQEFGWVSSEVSWKRKGGDFTAAAAALTSSRQPGSCKPSITCHRTNASGGGRKMDTSGALPRQHNFGDSLFIFSLYPGRYLSLPTSHFSPLKGWGCLQIRLGLIHRAGMEARPFMSSRAKRRISKQGCCMTKKGPPFWDSLLQQSRHIIPVYPGRYVSLLTSHL